MDVRLSFDTHELDEWTGLSIAKLGRTIPYRINRTTERVQQIEHAHVRSSFIIRGGGRAAFFFGSPARPGGAAGKITTRASVKQAVPYAELEVERRRWGGKGGPVLLAGFETGEERRPRTAGAKSIAVPLIGRPARPSIAGPVPPAFTIAGLRLTAYRGGRRVRRPARRRSTERGFGSSGSTTPAFSLEGVQWKGLQRTFLLPHTARAPLGAVFQRIGPERGDIREIYSFVRPFRLDTRLEYIALARQVAPAIFREEMTAGLTDALFHAALRDR